MIGGNGNVFNDRSAKHSVILKTIRWPVSSPMLQKNLLKASNQAFAFFP